MPENTEAHPGGPGQRNRESQTQEDADIAATPRSKIELIAGSFVSVISVILLVAEKTTALSSQIRSDVVTAILIALALGYALLTTGLLKRLRSRFKDCDLARYKDVLKKYFNAKTWSLVGVGAFASST